MLAIRIVERVKASSGGVWLNMGQVTRGQYLAVRALEQVGEPSERVLRCRNSLTAFAEYVIGLPPADHHLVWCRAWQTDQDSPTLSKIAGNNLRIAAPRDSAKTTYGTAFLAWAIGHNPNIRIIVTSSTQEIAQSISQFVKAIVESPKYKEIFPWVRKSHKWAERQWLIKRDQFLKDPTLLAVGMGGGIVSRRADLVLIDDPIKSSADIAAKEIREGMRLWYSEVLSPCVVPGGRVIVNCTRYRIDDIHGTDFMEQNGWEVIRQQAIIQGEQGEVSYWPGRYSLEVLRKKREQNPTAFASQYQNDPLPVGTLGVRPEWICRAALHHDFKLLTLGVDPAISKKETADYSALVLVGLAKNNRFQTVLARRGRWTLRELLGQIFKICDEWEGYRLRVVVEAIAYQAAIVDELKRQILMEDREIRVKEIKPRGDKESRLYGVTGVLETGDHSFAQGQAFDDLLGELINFGSMAHDDLADAWTMALRECLRQRELESRGI